MSTSISPIFEELANIPQGTTAIERLIGHFRAERQPYELFEAMKARARLGLGLPPVTFESQPPLAEATERALEAKLLEACRATGTMLLEEGKVREGWLYLRPVGDVGLAARLIAKIPVTEENAEDLIAVQLHEGVDVARGFRTLLERNGTCNSITVYEQVLGGRSKEQQRLAAAILLEHLYAELKENVRADIERRESVKLPPSSTLVEMLSGRRGLFEGGAYHLDTSHLAATVRFARVLQDPKQWQLAWELTQYGRLLSQPLQYPGEEPFRDTYPAHATFFSVLLDQNRDAGLGYFERKARSVDHEEHGTAAIETYIDLLDRVGRTREALDAAFRLIPSDVPLARVLPWLLDMAGRCGGIDGLMAYAQTRNDPLSFAICKAVATPSK